MKEETYLAWLPCEKFECYGLYDGGFTVTAAGEDLKPYLNDLLEKSKSNTFNKTWKVDAGKWHFGTSATRIIKAEIEQIRLH